MSSKLVSVMHLLNHEIYQDLNGNYRIWLSLVRKLKSKFGAIHYLQYCKLIVIAIYLINLLPCMLCFKHCGVVMASEVNGYEAFQSQIADTISCNNGTHLLFSLYSISAHYFFFI